MTIYAPHERCKTTHPLVNHQSEIVNLAEGRQIQAGCTCPENRIGIAEVGALPTPSATLPTNQTTMKTIALYLPKWLRPRLPKPTTRKPKTISLKDRQLLPRLPKQARSVIFSQENNPAGYRALWRL
jgi:hypothetical protein